MIQVGSPADFARLLVVWEDSVRATHDFLEEADIASLRTLIRDQALPAVQLRIYRDDQGIIQGFAGIDGDSLEMLFVSSAARGTGIGRQLVERVIAELGIRRVAVNEQNPQALGFYRRLGFEQVGRSPVDGQGRPFPLLLLRLTRT
ncbi:MULTISPECIES: GNAT family N-acetyltransferase [unclassified Pseudomonas]|uniref:GNAT family N-acetyltransferase n=1 Tax=unclassified Pseudomonas TaxID=196821 RepID=UPI002361C04C|nr:MULTISPECIES: GNAT family N-acetyltransferase [unclassified Pseudomonas]MDR6176891.1 putative acetyltransferase [Pseudomonas sp. SORGH_AS_0211]